MLILIVIILLLWRYCFSYFELTLDDEIDTINLRFTFLVYSQTPLKLFSLHVVVDLCDDVHPKIRENAVIV